MRNTGVSLYNLVVPSNGLQISDSVIFRLLGSENELSVNFKVMMISDIMKYIAEPRSKQYLN